MVDIHQGLKYWYWFWNRSPWVWLKITKISKIDWESVQNRISNFTGKNSVNRSKSSVNYTKSRRLLENRTKSSATSSPMRRTARASRHPRRTAGDALRAVDAGGELSVGQPRAKVLDQGRERDQRVERRCVDADERVQHRHAHGCSALRCDAGFGMSSLATWKPMDREGEPVQPPRFPTSALKTRLLVSWPRALKTGRPGLSFPEGFDKNRLVFIKTIQFSFFRFFNIFYFIELCRTHYFEFVNSVSIKIFEMDSSF
jgi:hypothetical protein